jgi:hypothetical protein
MDMTVLLEAFADTGRGPAPILELDVDVKVKPLTIAESEPRAVRSASRSVSPIAHTHRQAALGERRPRDRRGLSH